MSRRRVALLLGACLLGSGLLGSCSDDAGHGKPGVPYDSSMLHSPGPSGSSSP